MSPTRSFAAAPKLFLAISSINYSYEGPADRLRSPFERVISSADADSRPDFRGPLAAVPRRGRAPYPASRHSGLETHPDAAAFERWPVVRLQTGAQRRGCGGSGA